LVLPVPVVLLSLWWLSSHRHWITEQTLPGPGTVLDTLRAMRASGELWIDVRASVRRVAVGFLCGATLGVAVGTLMGVSNRIKEYLYPSLRMLASVPVLGWLPFLILWLGIGEPVKYVLIANAAFIPVTMQCYQGMRHVPMQYQEVARLYRLSRWQLFSRLLMPSAFPTVWGGLRYGLASCWLVLVLVELLASSEGLGYMMVYGQQMLQMDVLLAAVFVVGTIGYLLDRVLELTERRLLRWRRAAFT